MENPHKAEEYVDAGLALVQLGRWLQLCYPKVEIEGSQYDEDIILAELLSGDAGIYVDIGAHAPKECSNTWQFYKRGWRGLLIEPLPDCWGDLLLERREDRLCPMAASDRDGFATLRINRTISSLDPEWKNDATESIPVRTLPLKTILAMYSDFDWSQTRLCSIDVEGHEREVLLGIDWNMFYPEVIVIEYRDYNKDGQGKNTSAEWVQILKGNRYKMVHQNKLNQIWKRS